MVRLFILVKRKGSKVWRGAIPAKKNISLKKLRSILSKSVKSGFTAIIVTETQLKRLLKTVKVRRKVRRRTRKVRRRKVRRTRRRRRK